MEGRRNKDRPCTRWLDGVKKACNSILLELREAKVMCMSRQQKKDFVNSTKGGMNV